MPGYIYSAWSDDAFIAGLLSENLHRSGFTSGQVVRPQCLGMPVVRESRRVRIA